MKNGILVIQKTKCTVENIKPVAALSPATLHYLCKDYDIDANTGTKNMALRLMDWVSHHSD